MKTALIIYGLIWLGVFLTMLWNQRWPSRRDLIESLSALVVCMVLSACCPAIVATALALVALIVVVLFAICLVTIPIAVVSMLLLAVKVNINIRTAKKDRVRMLEDAQRQYDEGVANGRS